MQLKIADPAGGPKCTAWSRRTQSEVVSLASCCAVVVNRRSAAPRVCVRPMMLALLLALGARGGGGGSGQSGLAMGGGSTVPPVTPVNLPPTQAWTGHYIGAVKIADVTYFGDAVFTQDGEVRLYLGGPYDNGAELQLIRPESSEQFVGTVEIGDRQLVRKRPDHWTGICERVMEGEMRVTTSSGTETWLLNLQLWSPRDDRWSPETTLSTLPRRPT